MNTYINRLGLLMLGGFMSLTNYSVGQTESGHSVSSLPGGKEIYKPKEFSGQDWNSDTSRYSYKRMVCTENIAIFWEKGFGDNVTTPPDLEGRPMGVDLENLKRQLEKFYTFYRDSLQFVLPGSQSEKYRMMAMLQYSLEGTAYGGDYDQVVGAFWASPNRLQDPRLNAVAHELGHSFQLQLIADGDGVAWGGNGIFEMGTQWMLWHVNPHWIDDEKRLTKLFCTAKTFTVLLMCLNIGVKTMDYRLSGKCSGKEKREKIR